MRLLLSVVALSLMGVSCSPKSFETVIGGEDLDHGIFVAPTSDGGFVAVGYTRSFGQGGEDVYLVKTDISGNVLWTQTYGGSGDDNGWAVREIAGGLVIAGFTNSSGSGDFDCYLIKATLEGELQWSKTFGGPGRERCWGFLPGTDGGYVLVGETASAGRGTEDCYLIKTDASGDEVWSNTFGGEKGDRCFSIAHTDDGGFLLAGQTYSEGAGDRDVYLIKTDASGTSQWSKTFGGAASDVGHYVARTADGDFIVTGYTTSLAEIDDDPYVIRIDAGGTVKWTRVIPMEGINHTLTGEQTTDGGFVLGGFTESKSNGLNDVLLVKTGADGSLQWSKELFRMAVGGSSGYTVRATSDGGSILTGRTANGHSGGFDLFIVKMDRDGK
ncbi:MAG: hypothetical protein HKN13_11130 [Rhodothermales bacterium]|nr:hypothetical protein [Rhodothermales bacterium]